MSIVVAVGRGYTHSEHPLGWIISLQTATLGEIIHGGMRELATHVFPWFKMDNGETVYYEALLNEGWTGPKPIENVILWNRENEKRRLRMYDLTNNISMDQDIMNERLIFAEKRKGSWTYNKKQLLLHIRIERAIRRITGHSFFKPSVTSIICAEGAGIILDNPPLYSVLRECGVSDYDLLNPAMMERRDRENGKMLEFI